MARIARFVMPGFPHHVVQRGVRSMDIFRSDRDRDLYLNLLLEFCRRYEVTVWAWCLMTNHVHILAVPARETSLARAIGQAHRKYARMINRSEGVRGHLFQERFYSYPVQFDSHLLAAVRYIELNPVSAGLASEPEDYQWSSARHHSLAEPDRLVKDSPMHAMAGDWRVFLRQDTEAAGSREEIEKHLRTGRPLGDRAWVECLQASADRQLLPRVRGRKPGTRLKR